MSDDRLFATNTPIGRKWYYLNLLILSGITTVTYFFFTKKVIPGIEGADHITIANWILYFFLFSYFITFLSLIDRRLYDASGSRSKGLYKNISPVITFLILGLILIGVFNVFPSVTFGGREFTMNLNIANPIAYGLAAILGIFVVFIGTIRGKKSKS